jgi:hypothetical protein
MMKKAAQQAAQAAPQLDEASLNAHDHFVHIIFILNYIILTSTGKIWFKKPLRWWLPLTIKGPDMLSFGLILSIPAHY